MWDSKAAPRARRPSTNTPWETQVQIWSPVAIGEGNSTIEKWVSLDRKTIDKVREDLARIPDRLLKGLPGIVQDYLAETYGRRASLTTPRGRPTDPYKRLRGRHWLPKEFIGLMKQVMAEEPKVEPSNYQQRYSLWEEESNKLFRIARERDTGLGSPIKCISSWSRALFDQDPV